MKKVLFYSCVLLIMVSCKPKSTTVWTKEYEEKQYNDIYQSLGQSMNNPQERKKFATYVIESLKKKLPNGLESIAPDSLHKMAFELGREYTLKGQMHSAISWTATSVQNLHNELVNEIGEKIADPKLRDQYCDCVIAQLKKHNPDSLSLPIPDSLRLAVNAVCNH